ncbi:molybdate ABC transporter permease subunit [Chitiniphilus purpureus]|uniref:Molybdenum transport system permease n=1 Tax=Chitiniphilus purpureus TaxID=2981137 RepID=A0ABY6DNA6_9NEIS|nr:molybdate ABC transporter permease subunit [Chitiniphilus sp. CD1]UXY15852.1 molybdate ABC transporter permease subunit [Chitiniphilus sp. CD1]
MSPEDWLALRTTLTLAGVTTVLLFVAGLPLAWWLARSRSAGAVLVDALVALPLVLPPTVLGFYLLLALGPAGGIGQALQQLGLPALAFSFPGLVIASMLYSLPFMVQPLRDAFAAVPAGLLEAAATLRASPWDRFASVVLPCTRRGVISALTLTFAHTIGEFGVVLMVGGNIPGATRVLSIAIYDHVEALDYAAAHRLAGGLLLASLAMLLPIYALNRRRGLAGGAA